LELRSNFADKPAMGQSAQGAKANKYELKRSRFSPAPFFQNRTVNAEVFFRFQQISTAVSNFFIFFLHSRRGIKATANQKNFKKPLDNPRKRVYNKSAEGATLIGFSFNAF
jgi:hypothetical protein